MIFVNINVLYKYHLCWGKQIICRLFPLMKILCLLVILCYHLLCHSLDGVLSEQRSLVLSFLVILHYELFGHLLDHFPGEHGFLVLSHAVTVWQQAVPGHWTMSILIAIVVMDVLVLSSPVTCPGLS